MVARMTFNFICIFTGIYFDIKTVGNHHDKNHKERKRSHENWFLDSQVMFAAATGRGL